MRRSEHPGRKTRPTTRSPRRRPIMSDSALSSSPNPKRVKRRGKHFLACPSGHALESRMVRKVGHGPDLGSRPLRCDGRGCHHPLYSGLFWTCPYPECDYDLCGTCVCSLADPTTGTRTWRKAFLPTISDNVTNSSEGSLEVVWSNELAEAFRAREAAQSQSPPALTTSVHAAFGASASALVRPRPLSPDETAEFVLSPPTPRLAGGGRTRRLLREHVRSCLSLACVTCHTDAARAIRAEEECSAVCDAPPCGEWDRSGGAVSPA